MIEQAAPSTRLERVKDLASFLYTQRVKGFQVPDAPHFDTESTRYFLDRLRSAQAYLEYGSGGSTIVVGQSGKPFTTVDSDRYFLSEVRRKLGSNGANGRFIYADIGMTREWGAPMFRNPTPARLARWRHYAEAPFEGGTFTPDLVLVDGRFRVACALVTIRELGHRGKTTLLIDDSTERPHYQEVERFARLRAMHGHRAEFELATPPAAAALNAAIDRHEREWR